MKVKSVLFSLAMSLFLVISFSQGTFAQNYEEVLKSYLDKASKVVGDTQKDSIQVVGEDNLEYVGFTCPKCGKDFRIQVDKDDIEFQKGFKSVICPYDGTEFFPKIEGLKRSGEERQKEVMLRSPYTGKEFVADLGFEEILSGILLTDPYTGEKFRYKAELFKDQEPSSYRIVKCPKDGRTFKVRIEQGETIKDVICPYDGTTFSLGEEAAEFSIIEKVFARQLSSKVSKNLKQFGYDIFPETLERPAEEGRMPKQRISDFYRSYTEGATPQYSGLTSQGASPFEREMFAPMISVPVGPDYILGPYDMLIINMWGQIQQSSPVMVDGDGKIMLPKVGPVYVWGMKFTDAEKLIKEKLLDVYANVEISIAMGRLRTIRVFVLGEVKRPGAYMLSSQSTVFHSLYAAGGPTKLGTMRKIKLIRNNEEKIIDLYSYLLDGNKDEDHGLMSNDTIMVPPIGDVVGIAGNVKRPAIYETTSPIGLNEVLKFCGGVNPAGYLQRIQVERIIGHEKKIVQDFEFSNPGSIFNESQDVILHDGDLVLISPISQIRYNYVNISGNVKRPGDYEFISGMNARDLLEKCGGILPQTYFERAEIYRLRQDGPEEVIPINLNEVSNDAASTDIELKEWDKVIIYAKTDVVPASFVEINGAVNKPGRYELSTDMKLSDLIFRAGGLTHAASATNAELFRIAEGENPRVLKINIESTLTSNPDKDLILKEGDHLFVREETNSTGKRIIVLKGEFKYPGEYAVEDRERLSSVIKRAGGFTENAFLKGAILTRRSVRITQEKMLANFIETEQQRLLQEQASLAVGSTDSQRGARMELVKYRQNRLQELEKIGASGRMIIKVDRLNKFAGSEYDIEIEDGDILEISTPPSSVQVVGNVYNSSVFTFVEGKGKDYYLNKAGGFTKYADKNKIYIIAADGTSYSKFASARKIERGDTIVVPEEIRYRTQPGLLLKDTVGIVYQITLGAIAIAALD